MADQDKFLKYINYIELSKNLTVAEFDTDWLPIGPRVRKEMIKRGIIVQSRGKISLCPQTSGK